jgi:hypothetical protein
MPDSPQIKYKVRKEPRISVAPLAHYCSTPDPLVRASILQAAKFQKVAGIVQTTEGRRGIRAHLADIKRSKRALDGVKAALTTKSQSTFVTDFIRETAERNLELLAVFERAEQQLGLGRYGFESAPSSQPSLKMSGVAVSVQLDLFVPAGIDEEGNDRIGGALLHLSKSVPIPGKFKKEETQLKKHEARLTVDRFMAALIHEHLRFNFPDRGSPSREHCLVIDPYLNEVATVFGQLEPQLKRLRIACSEIARSWEDITPPNEYGP